jgi:hypothetical protein
MMGLILAYPWHLDSGGVSQSYMDGTLYGSQIKLITIILQRLSRKTLNCVEPVRRLCMVDHRYITWLAQLVYAPPQKIFNPAL